jgi:uncharacterized DUF497 family protein
MVDLVLLVVAYTTGDKGRAELIWLISARRATPKGRRIYEQADD